MKIRIVNDINNIDRDSWNSLVSESPINTIFQTYEWHMAWLKIFGIDLDVFIVCVEDDNNAIEGIAPLILCKGKGGRLNIRFIGHGKSDYLDFLYRKDKLSVLKSMLIFINEHINNVYEMELHNIPAHSETLMVINEFCNECGCYYMKSDIVSCPAVVFDEYNGYGSDIRNKKSLNQQQRYLSKKTGYHVVHMYEASKIILHLDRFFEQHIERWRRTATPSLFLNDQNRLFYRELLLQMDGNGWIIFTAMQNKDMPIAFHYGFKYNNKIIYYKPSFEISLSKYSPGRVLLKEIIDHAINRRYDEIDYTGGDESYKSKYSNMLRENISLIVFNSLINYKYRAMLVNLKSLIKNATMGYKFMAAYKKYFK